MNAPTHRRRLGFLATACVAALLSVAIAPSVSVARSFGGTLATEQGRVDTNAEQLSCLGATPDSIIDNQLRGEIGSTIDGLGRGHLTMNTTVFFSLYAPDPLHPEEPGELLYRGQSEPAQFSAFVEEWPAEGFVVTPFDSVTFDVRSPTGAEAQITVTVIGFFFPEDEGIGLAFGVARCT